MKKLLLLLCSLAVVFSATTYDVCASGCYTTSVQTALNAAAGGDIVELRSGEVFEGSFSIPYRTDGGVVIVRSSRWRELPPKGTRVTLAHQPFMATLRAQNSSDAILTAAYDEKHVSSVDLDTEEIVFGGSHGFPEGSPFVCRVYGGTAPITEYTLYYAKDVTSTRFKVSLTPGGSALNLTTLMTATTFRCTRNHSIKGWHFTGVEFSGKVGSPSQYNLILVGGDTMERSGIPEDIHFDRVYVHGIQTENGAKNCIVLNGKNVSVTDSRIEFCQREGEEAHAILSYLSPSMLIRNNYIAAGSINMLIGGAFVFTPNLVNGDDGGIQIIGNHFHKPMYLKYRAGTGETGVPSGSCSDDALRLRTTTGVLYKCTSNTWNPLTCVDDEYYRRTDVTQNCPSGACNKCVSGAYAADTVYRAGPYAVKNLFEIKSAMNTLIEGNVFENNWAGNGDQSGIAVWITSQVTQGEGQADPWVRGEKISFRNNFIKNSDLGLRVTTYGGITFGVANNRISVTDNLGIGIGTTTYGTVNNNGSSLQIGGRCDDCVWSHNTMYPGGAGGGNGMQFDTSAVTRLLFANNLTPRNSYGVRGDAGDGCTGITTLPGVVDGDDLLVNNALVDQLADGGHGSIGACATNTKYVAGPWSTHVVDGAGGDLRLKPTSPYSAACSSGCDFTGTDGKDLGADVDKVESATCGAVSGLPCLGITAKVQLGSTKVVVSYTAPSSSSCTVKLYADAGRVTLHADTADSSKWVDTRTGAITNGIYRQMVLGLVSALTANTEYQVVVNCSGSIAYQKFRTLPTGSGAYVVRIKYSSARTGAYGSTTSLGSSISSAADHSFSIAQGDAGYYQEAGGLLKAYVAP